MARRPLFFATGFLLAAPGLAQDLLVVEENFETVLLVSRVDGSILNPVLVNMNVSTGSAPNRPVQAIDVKGEIWIPDAGADVVFRFSGAGDYLGEFGTGRNELGGLARVGNRVWVTNSGSGFGKALKEFDLFGNLIEVHDTAATSDPMDVRPYGDLLLVSDRAGHDLDLYDLDGEFVSTFHDSDGILGIDEPRQIHVRASGNVLVGGSGNLSGIYEYDATGKQVAYYDTQAQGFPDVRGVHELLDGNILFTTTQGIHVFDTTTGVIHTCFGGVVAGHISTRAPFDSGRVVTEIIDSTGDGMGNELGFPSRPVLGPGGDVYLSGSSFADRHVFRISPGGVVTHVWDAGSLTAGSVAVDGPGNVFVDTGNNDTVVRIAPDGTETVVIDGTGDGMGNTLNNVGDIAVDASGNLYLTGFFSDNAFVVTPGGSVTEIIDSTGDGAGNALSGPRTILVDDTTGDVYIVAFDDVFRIESGGAITQVIGPSGDGMGNTLIAPGGLALDPTNGDLYVSDFLGDRVFRVQPNGTITVVLDATGDGAGNGVDQPVGLVVDGDGVLYVVGQNNDSEEAGRLFEVRPDGTVVMILGKEGDGLGNEWRAGAFIAIDAAENLYVTGQESYNVFKVGAPLSLGGHYCDPAVSNSTGCPALVTATGSDVAADNLFALNARDMPPGQPSYFLASQTQGFVQAPPGSQGNLCLGGQIGRFADQVQSSGPFGAISIDVDLTQMPPGAQTVLPGQTWSFQAWYRDQNRGTTSNFTNGVAVPFS